MQCCILSVPFFINLLLYFICFFKGNILLVKIFYERWETDKVNDLFCLKSSIIESTAGAGRTAELKCKCQHATRLKWINHNQKKFKIKFITKQMICKWLTIVGVLIIKLERWILQVGVPIKQTSNLTSARIPMHCVGMSVEVSMLRIAQTWLYFTSRRFPLLFFAIWYNSKRVMNYILKLIEKTQFWHNSGADPTCCCLHFFLF